MCALGVRKLTYGYGEGDRSARRAWTAATTTGSRPSCALSNRSPTAYSTANPTYTIPKPNLNPS